MIFQDEHFSLYVTGIKLSQRKELLEFIKNDIQVEIHQAFYREQGSVRDFLAFCGLADEVIDVLEPHLVDLGVESVDDLTGLTEEDIDESAGTYIY